MPPKIKENIISQLPDEEQLFARLTLQQVSKEMHQQLLKVKNGSVQDFDAFLKKTAKQLGPISTNYLYFLLYGNTGTITYKTNTVLNEFTLLRDSLATLQNHNIKEIEIPSLILAGLFTQWPVAVKWLNQNTAVFGKQISNPTSNESIALDLYFYAGILFNGSLITKNQLIPLPPQAIESVVRAYSIFVSSTFFGPIGQKKLVLSPLFTKLIDIGYSINNLPAQKNLITTSFKNQAKKMNQSLSQPYKDDYYKKLKELSSLLHKKHIQILEAMINQVKKTTVYQENNAIQVQVKNLSTWINSFQNSIPRIDDIDRMLRHVTNIYNKIPANEYRYLHDLKKTHEMIINNFNSFMISPLLNPPYNPPTKRPAEGAPEDEPAAKAAKRE